MEGVSEFDRKGKVEVFCCGTTLFFFCFGADSCRFSHDVKAYLEKKSPDIGDKCPIWDVRGVSDVWRCLPPSSHSAIISCMAMFVIEYSFFFQPDANLLKRTKAH